MFLNQENVGIFFSQNKSIRLTKKTFCPFCEKIRLELRNIYQIKTKFLITRKPFLASMRPFS